MLENMPGSRSKRRRRLSALFWVLSLGTVYAAESALVPSGTLRATFIDTNPVQARMAASTGQAVGPAADLTRALAAELAVQFSIRPAPGVAGVIETVRSGTADIGFVAFDATRATQVEFAQTYLLAHNTYIVRANSPLLRLSDFDRPGIRIGVGKGDAGDLFLTRILHDAELRRRPSSELLDGIAALKAGELDAYAANRTRLLAIAAGEPGLRLADENFYSVEQSIAVSKGNHAGLRLVNGFLDRARASGLIRDSISRAGLHGVDVAPPNTR
jgi:polar amino acid transport system substrate-binding protein